MYTLKVNGAILTTGSKSDCLDYMLRYKLHHAVITYQLPEKTGRNWIKSACKELACVGVMFAAVTGYFNAIM